MTIFEGLLMAHLLGDWVLQTEWQAHNKASDWRALLAHIAIYHTIVFIVLYFGFSLRVVPVTSVVVILAVLHAILDKKSAVEPIMRALRITVKRQPDGWLAIAVDQSIHLLLLGIAAIYLASTVTS